MNFRASPQAILNSLLYLHHLKVALVAVLLISLLAYTPLLYLIDRTSQCCAFYLLQHLLSLLWRCCTASLTPKRLLILILFDIAVGPPLERSQVYSLGILTQSRDLCWEYDTEEGRRTKTRVSILHDIGYQTLKADNIRLARNQLLPPQPLSQSR
jgi:hypothetical protein